MAGYFAYRMAGIVAKFLPRRQAYWVGMRIADVYHAFDAPARRAVASNLAQILAWRGIIPARSALPGLTRKTFQNYGKYIVDFFRMAHLDKSDIERLVSIEHPERLEAAYRRGRGVVLVTAHLGNWELGGAVLCALGYPVNAAVAPVRFPRLERLLRRQRERRGVRVVQIGRSARELLRRLKAGECAALLADRDFSREHQSSEFFGRTVHLPRGPAWLAHRAGAPVVPVFLLRQEDDTYLLRVHEPIDPETAGGINGINERIRDVLQNEIATYPQQWFVFHDFWEPERTSPA
jgi:KDO2-lipid IV(A) lauroyltransferase